MHGIYTYYLNTPAGHDALRRDIDTAGNPVAKSQLQAGLQRLEQERDPQRKEIKNVRQHAEPERHERERDAGDPACAS